MARGLRKVTHLFPGEHYVLVRPIRDDFRRSVIDVPRRARRTQTRRRRAERKKIDKRLHKQLLKDTHKGRPAKRAPVTRRAPATMNARSPLSREVQVFRAHRPPNFSKDAGIKFHKPRVLSPHHPYAYHVFPARRVAQHLRKHVL